MTAGEGKAFIRRSPRLQRGDRWTTRGSPCGLRIRPRQPRPGVSSSAGLGGLPRKQLSPALLTRISNFPPTGFQRACRLSPGLPAREGSLPLLDRQQSGGGGSQSRVQHSRGPPEPPPGASPPGRLLGIPGGLPGEVLGAMGSDWGETRKLEDTVAPRLRSPSCPLMYECTDGPSTARREPTRSMGCSTCSAWGSKFNHTENPATQCTFLGDRVHHHFSASLRSPTARHSQY